MKKHLTLIFSLLVAVVLFTALRNFSPKMYTATITDCFDTVSELTIYSRTQKQLNDCIKYMHKMEKMFSSTDENAEIYKLNHGYSGALSNETKELLEFSENFTKENPETFSVYLNPLIEAWDIKNNEGTIPNVTEALEAVKSHTSVNLGAVAKGYATDKLCRQLTDAGVTSALLSLGGNAYAIGKKPTGEKWKIGIQNPNDADKIIGVISAENLAVITSGDYQRYFELNGVKYHHIFNPKTGFPANNGLHSVTIIGENGMLCDALSTAAFVSGLDDGIALVKKYNMRGIFITDDTVYFSKSLEDIFKQTDFSYKYEFIY